jgi:predicted acylesterase/phospholipase RssA
MHWNWRAASVAVLALLLASNAFLAADGRLEAAARLSNKHIPPEKHVHSKQPNSPERQTFDKNDQDIASVPGIPDARFFADSERDFAIALPQVEGPWLILSGGGADGAYGAGLLVGWTVSGHRPQFSAVTGVSTGALIATYAFLGERYDEPLREAYTTITAADVFEHHATDESLLDTWPLRDSIAKRVTPKLLSDIAAEHQRGRRLFVVTTNLDAERAVVWNMGAIAAHGDEAALGLFRDVLLASASVPGLFPPAYIEGEANGRRFQEMHADGGMSGPFFVAPEAWLTNLGNQHLPARQLFIVVNSKLTPDFQSAERNLISILGRSFSAALKAAARAEIALVEVAAQRGGTGCQVAYIDDEFNQPSHGPFDPDYMRALFDLGTRQSRDGTAFHDQSKIPGRQTRAW